MNRFGRSFYTCVNLPVNNAILIAFQYRCPLTDLFETLVSRLDNLILVVNRELVVVFANAGFGKFRGQRASDFVGMRLKEVLEISDRQWELLSCEMEGHTSPSELPDHRDSRKSPACGGEARDPLHANQGASSSLNPPSVVTLGRNIFTYQIFDLPLVDGGEPGYGLVFNDLTREKDFLDRMTQAENTASLRTLVAGIAHEISNPLHSVMSFAEAMTTATDPEKLRQYGHKVAEGSSRIGKTISRISACVQNKGSGAPSQVDIRETLEAGLRFALLPLEKQAIDVEMDFKGSPQIKGEAEDFQQIWINILNNAVQAMNGVGTLKITGEVSVDTLFVSIQDSGPGMTPETLRKAFNPFFTTKMQGEGTGLGLSITQRLVEKYRGSIDVQSREGEGVRVIVSLPVNG